MATVNSIFEQPAIHLRWVCFLKPKEYALLGRICKHIRQIIIDNEAYWQSWCKVELYQPQGNEKCYFTFCRMENMENSVYRRGETLGNPVVKMPLSHLADIQGINQPPAYQRRAINPANGNLLVMESVPDDALFKKPIIPSIIEEVDRLHEISADDGKIVNSWPLPRCFSSNRGVGVEKMRVISNKILLISNKIFFAIDLHSLKIVQEIPLTPLGSIECVDVTEHEGAYLFMFQGCDGSQILRLENKSLTTFGPFLSKTWNLTFCDNLQNTVTCFYSAHNQIYSINEQSFQMNTPFHLEYIRRAPPTLQSIFKAMGGETTVSWIDRRFMSVASREEDKLFIWDQEKETKRLIDIPLYQSTFHIGVRDEDLILYIDSKIYSIKTIKEPALIDTTTAGKIEDRM